MKKQFAWLTAGTLAAAFCFTPTVLSDDEKPKSDDAVLAGPDVDVKKAKKEEKMQMRDEGAFSGRGRRPRNRGGNMSDRGPGGIHVMLRQLDLTEDQREQVKSILEEHKEEAKAWREENKDELVSIREEMREARENQDREKAQELRQKLGALMASAPRADVREQVMGVLTDEQKSKLKEIRAKREKDMKKRREQGAEGERPRRPRGEGAEGERPRRPRGEGGERRRRPRPDNNEA